MRKTIFICILSLALVLLMLVLPMLHLTNSGEVYALELSSLATDREVVVSASIGEPKLTLFGYGPVGSQVTLNGIGILEVTAANDIGYFEFNNVFLPRGGDGQEFYPEFCLQAHYEEISTQPTCLAPLPSGKFDYRIGPVVLSPTLALEKGTIFTAEQVKAYGRTLPNTEITVFLAKEENQGFSDFLKSIWPIKEASAYSIPTYQITSDSNGNYEFNLPSETSSRWRIFAASDFQGKNSAKSNTLSFWVKSSIFRWLEKAAAFFGLLWKDYFPYLIIFELVIIGFLIRLLTGKREKKETRREPLNTL